MSSFNEFVSKLLSEMAANTAAGASMFGDAAAAAAANPAMQGDDIYNPKNALPVAPADLILGKKKTKTGKKTKNKPFIQRRSIYLPGM